MTYDELLAAQPTPMQHGRKDLAQAYVTAIISALHNPTVPPLTTSQRAYLYRLYHKWWRRAAGQDLKWMMRAPRPGRPSKAQPEAAMTDDDETLDPLSARLIKKYGPHAEGPHSDYDDPPDDNGDEQ